MNSPPVHLWLYYSVDPTTPWNSWNTYLDYIDSETAQLSWKLQHSTTAVQTRETEITKKTLVDPALLKGTIQICPTSRRSPAQLKAMLLVWLRPSDLRELQHWNAYVFLKSLRSPSPHTLYFFLRNAHHWSHSGSPDPKAMSFISFRRKPRPDQWPINL